MSGLYSFNKPLWLVVGLYLLYHITSFYPVDLLPKRRIKITISHISDFESLGSPYYILNTDKGTYINRDSILRLKFNTYDIQSYIFNVYRDKGDLKCEAIVTGERNYSPTPVLPNILSIKC